MAETPHSETFKQILDCLHDLDQDSRIRALKAAAIYFGIEEETFGAIQARIASDVAVATDNRSPVFGQSVELPPKDFLHQKAPETDVDRVACLAYYLNNYRNTRLFKTLDISALNTEAAQMKFSNTAMAVSNAAAAGLIVPAGKGQKQISALGERYVEALPDRDAAREIASKYRNRRKRSKKSEPVQAKNGSR